MTAEPLAGSSAYVQIDPASFRTGNEQRDSNVRSERLLDAGRYPIITFRSEGVDGPASAGTLTVRNVTMPVTLSIPVDRADRGDTGIFQHQSEDAHRPDRVPDDR